MTRSNVLIPDWPAPSNIKAATSLRLGGVSMGSFCSFNLALHVGDDNERVLENRKLLASHLLLPNEPFWLQQIHSNRVCKAEAKNFDVTADASYSNEAGVVCAVMTADCLPILLCDTSGSQVAAVHAGWRGLQTGIIAKAVATFEHRKLIAWLGPAIGPGCFEVGSEVRDAFIGKNPAFTEGFKECDGNKWLADIYLLARLQLNSLGIINIFGGDFCTYSDSERFFSYRRNKTTGRMATLIWKE